MIENLLMSTQTDGTWDGYFSMDYVDPAGNVWIIEGNMDYDPTAWSITYLVLNMPPEVTPFRYPIDKQLDNLDLPLSDRLVEVLKEEPVDLKSWHWTEFA